MNDVDVILNSLIENQYDGLAWIALGDALDDQGEPERAELARDTMNLFTWRSMRLEEKVKKILKSGVVPCVPTITNCVGMKMVLIPMRVRRGEEPDKSLFMSAHQVTQAQYRAVTRFSPSHFIGKDLPVETVRFFDADLFCSTLTHLDKSGLFYRLPTEAEWEYACAAGTTTLFNIGGEKEDMDMSGWYKDNSNGRTHEVGKKIPNAWGLYDMHGNVWEWCSDWSASQSCYSARGGSWMSLAEQCRTWYSGKGGKNFTGECAGFRVVATRKIKE